MNDASAQASVEAKSRHNFVRETFAYHIASAENGLCKVPRRVADDMLQSYIAMENRLSELADANTNSASSDLSSLRKGAEVEKARRAVERLANVQMNISLEEWGEISNAILSALVSGSREDGDG